MTQILAHCPYSSGFAKALDETLQKTFDELYRQLHQVHNFRARDLVVAAAKLKFSEKAVHQALIKSNILPVRVADSFYYIDSMHLTKWGTSIESSPFYEAFKASIEKGETFVDLPYDKEIWEQVLDQSERPPAVNQSNPPVVPSEQLVKMAVCFNFIRNNGGLIRTIRALTRQSDCTRPETLSWLTPQFLQFLKEVDARPDFGISKEMLQMICKLSGDEYAKIRQLIKTPDTLHNRAFLFAREHYMKSGQTIEIGNTFDMAQITALAEDMEMPPKVHFYISSHGEENPADPSSLTTEKLKAALPSFIKQHPKADLGLFIYEAEDDLVYLPKFAKAFRFFNWVAFDFFGDDANISPLLRGLEVPKGVVSRLQAFSICSAPRLKPNTESAFFKLLAQHSTLSQLTLRINDVFRTIECAALPSVEKATLMMDDINGALIPQLFPNLRELILNFDNPVRRSQATQSREIEWVPTADFTALTKLEKITYCQEDTNYNPTGFTFNFVNDLKVGECVDELSIQFEGGFNLANKAEVIAKAGDCILDEFQPVEDEKFLAFKRRLVRR